MDFLLEQTLSLSPDNFILSNSYEYIYEYIYYDIYINDVILYHILLNYRLWKIK
jgi:hypothetical protein